MAAGASVITVTEAGPEDHARIAGLFQFYVYDFSEMEPADSERFEPGPDGLFEPYPYLDDYWRAPGRTPLLIRKGELPVGFALVNDHGHTGQPVDHNMAEFFVLRKHRRGQVGAQAVRTILPRFPGVWEIAMAERNVGAKAFWPRIVGDLPGVRDLQTVQGDGVAWTGPILRFRMQP